MRCGIDGRSPRLGLTTTKGSRGMAGHALTRLGGWTRWRGFVPGIATAVAAIAGHGVAAAALLVVTVSLTMSPRRALLARLLEAFLWTSFAIVAVFQAAGLLGRAAITPGPTARILVALVGVALALAAAGAAWMTAGAARTSRATGAAADRSGVPLARLLGCGAPPRAGRPETDLPLGARLLTGLPALVVVGLAIITAWQPINVGLIWFFFGGDNITHTEFALRVAVSGAMDYGFDPYPIGWHAFAAVPLTVSLTGTELTPGALVTALQHQATLTWLLFALLTAALSRLGFLLAARTAPSRAWISASTAAGCGAIALTAPVLMFVLWPGFQTLGYAAVVVLVAVNRAVEDGRSAGALATVSAGIVLTAHGWQAAVLGPAVVWLLVATRLWRGGHRWLVLGWAAVTAAVSAPPMLALVTTVGVGLAGANGHVERLFWEFLPFVVPSVLVILGFELRDRRLAGATGGTSQGTRAAATGQLGTRSGRATPWRPLGSWRVVLLAAVPLLLTAAALARSAGVPLLAYYPRKMLWVGALVLVPLLPAALAPILSAGARRWAGVSVLVTLATLAGLAVTSVQAAELPRGRIGNNDVLPLLRTLYAPGAKDAYLAWRSPANYRDPYARQLLDLFRPLDTRPQLPRGDLTPEQECEVLAGTPRPTVVTADLTGATDRYAVCRVSVHFADATSVLLTVVGGPSAGGPGSGLAPVGTP